MLLRGLKGRREREEGLCVQLFSGEKVRTGKEEEGSSFREKGVLLIPKSPEFHLQVALNARRKQENKINPGG